MNLVFQIQAVVILSRYDIGFCQSDGITHTRGIALGIIGKQMLHEILVHEQILRSENGASGTIECQGTALGIEYCRLSYVGYLSVKRHYITGRCHPQG